jgi:hypothetical protein
MKIRICKPKPGWFRKAKYAWFTKRVSDYRLWEPGCLPQEISYSHGTLRGRRIEGTGFMRDVFNQGIEPVFWIGWELHCKKSNRYSFEFRTPEDVKNQINKTLGRN